MPKCYIEMSLFGACHVAGCGDALFEIVGTKHRALFALLATAPLGRRSRSFLQETLWGTTCYDTGRQSLRRALSDIKALMADSYAEVIATTNSDVTLNLQSIRFKGQPGVGTFLEGLDVKETAFLRWVSSIRENPAQLDGLFRSSVAKLLPTTLPAIAVLPFRPIGCGETGEVVGDWIAEELTRALSRSRLIAVTSHLSSRQFIRTGFDLAAVHDTLKVNYCVSGSLRQAGSRMVVDFDLVELSTSRLLLTRQVQCDAKRFMAAAVGHVQSIAQIVAASMAEEALVVTSRRAPNEIEDHQLVIGGVNLMHRPTLKDFARSRLLLEEALSRSPATPEVLAWLSKWHTLSVFNRWTSDTERETQCALDYAARALDIAPDNSFCLTIDGFAHGNLRRRLDIAEERYAAALEANTNDALCWLLKGALHTFRDEATKAIEASKQARALSPIDPFSYYFDAHTAGAYLCAEDYETAFLLADAAFRKNSRHLSSLRIKIFAAHYSGRTHLVRDLGQQLLSRQPNFTVASYMHTHPSSQSRMGEMMRQALIAAYIPTGV